TMTVNVARLTLDVVEILRGHGGKSVASARLRARHTWPVVAGFAMGCGLAAACQATIGQWSLALPAGLALLAIGLGGGGETRPRQSLQRGRVQSPRDRRGWALLQRGLTGRH